jgi:two-component system, NarL family, sensor kinase
MYSSEINIISSILLSTIIILGLLIFLLIILSKHRVRILETRTEIEKVKIKSQNEILEAQLEIQEETFKKISREIHDNISLGLTLAKLQLTNLLQNTNTTTISNSIDLISKSLVDLNDISKSLDAKQLVAHGLINALESEISILNKTSLYKANLEIIGSPIYFDEETDLVLLRIFQEACNNIVKHAQANCIMAYLIYKETYVLMKIVDNGIGFDVEAAKQKKEIRKMAGLKNFENRSRLINAQCEIISTIGTGTAINIKIPIKSNQYEKRND